MDDLYTKIHPSLAQETLKRLNFIRCKRQEYFICLSLDSSGSIIRRRTVTIGLLDTTIVHPREVFAGALEDRAASVIVAHNHPSGDPNPSREDINTTQQLIAAGQILGTPVQDHIVVAKDDTFSFKENSLIL